MEMTNVVERELSIAKYRVHSNFSATVHSNVENSDNRQNILPRDAMHARY